MSSLLLVHTLFAIDLPIEEVEKRVFQENITVNSKIVQLSSAKEHIMARVGGKITKYLVSQGQHVKKGQAIAKIESLEISKLSSELRLLQKQLIVHNKNYKILKNLYDTGLESMQNVNREERERDETSSQIETIKAQLKMLNVSSKGVIKSSYTIYAQGSGKVAKILIPTNSVVDANTPLVSIVKGGSSFLAKSYIPLRYASKVNIGQKGVILYGGKSYKIHISQILPELDEQTQQMVVLCSLDEVVDNLFVNAYVDSELSIGTPKSYLAIKKTALSFFNNEWVVFVPEHHEDKHDEHDKTRRGRASVPTHANDEKEHEEHKKHGHDDHEEEEEVPYDIRVVKIIKQNRKWVAIEGLKEHEDYVSDKSYYIKSMLLKSSLGGHGH